MATWTRRTTEQSAARRRRPTWPGLLLGAGNRDSLVRGIWFLPPKRLGVSLGTIEVAECTSDSQATQSICHENDMEGVLITIQKLTDRPYGAFLTMETISHSDILSFKDYDTSPSREVSGHFHLCSLLACDVQFLEGDWPPVCLHRIQKPCGIRR